MDNWAKDILEYARVIALTGLLVLKRVLFYGFSQRPSFTDLFRLDGKTAVITGGNSGIGFEVAKALYEQGARVIIASRNVKFTRRAAERIKKDAQSLNTTGEIIAARVDLCSLDSVSEFARDLLASEGKIDFLINNAGSAAQTKALTVDGLESTFAIYLGHFLLTISLLPILRSSRIINVTSFVAKIVRIKNLGEDHRHYDALQAYARSKAAIILFTEELSLKGVAAYSVNPGIVNTPLTQGYSSNYIIWSMSRIALKLALTPSEGASSVLRLIFKTCDSDSGAYYDEYGPSESLNDKQAAKKLWKLSWDLVNRVDKPKQQTKNLNTYVAI